jgi:hypothetical protein
LLVCGFLAQFAIHPFAKSFYNPGRRRQRLAPIDFLCIGAAATFPVATSGQTCGTGRTRFQACS